jgi:hypothetical protein
MKVLTSGREGFPRRAITTHIAHGPIEAPRKSMILIITSNNKNLHPNLAQ